MELEPAHAVVGDQPPGPAHRRLAGQRVHRAERDQHVGVLGGPVGDLLAGQRGVAGRGGGVHGEHHGGQPALPVVVRDLLHRRRPVVVGLEVLGRRGQQFVVQGQPAVAVGLDVHVHVDPLQGGKVEARHLKTPYTPGRRAARPAWLASISAGPICAVTTLPGRPGLWHRLRCGAATTRFARVTCSGRRDRTGSDAPTSPRSSGGWPASAGSTSTAIPRCGAGR